MMAFSSEEELDCLRAQVAELQKQLSVFRRVAEKNKFDCAEDFYQGVATMLQDKPCYSYCMIHIDIERFKLFNEWYGRREGDCLIRHLEAQLLEKASNCEGLGIHLSADTFALLLPAAQCNAEDLEPEVLGWMEGSGHEGNFLPVVGIYPISDHALPVSTMCDRAALAADSVKGNYVCRIAIYNEEMGRMLAEGQELLSEFRRSLKNGEFVLYVQPKCSMRTGKIVGCEMLVRWQHPKRGLLSPNEFIPLLERNNLILELDVYVWEQTCYTLRRWIDAGNRPIPASVNVSRVDVYDLDLCGILTGLIEKYRIDPSLLELEITETSYTQETDQIVGVVRDLRERGFTVLMDDFGSGYSSLNMLKEVDVDILKLDLRFLKMNMRTQSRGSNILESVMQMAKWMDLRVIAEGVETHEQVDFLLCIGCEYGQGYYFYRPMPTQDFETLLLDPERVDFRGVVGVPQQEFRLDELIASNTISEAFFNNVLGGVAIYDLYGEQFTLIQVNDGYYRATGCNPVDLELKKHVISSQVHPDDWWIVLQGLKEAESHPILGSEIEFRRYRLSGEMMWMRLRLFFVGEQSGHKRFYASVSDVTGRKNAEDALRESQRQLRAVLGISGEKSFPKKESASMKDCAATSLTLHHLWEENRISAVSAFAGLVPAGMTGCYLEEGYPIYFANEEMVRIAGLRSYDEFFSHSDGLAINFVHPNDRSLYNETMHQIVAEGQVYHIRYRLLHGDGSWNWILETGRSVRSEEGRLALVCVCVDISDQVALEQSFERFLHNAPCDMFRVRNGRYEALSTNLASKMGYTQQEYYALLQVQNGSAMTCPEDRPLIKEAFEKAIKTKGDVDVFFRTTCKDGSYRPLSLQATYGEDEQGGVCYFGIFTDLTDIMQTQKRLDISEKKLRVALRQAGLDVWEYNPASQTLRIFSVEEEGRFCGLPLGVVIENFPEQAIESGWVAPESRQTIRDFVAACCRDERDIAAEIQVIEPDGASLWLRLLGDGVPSNGDFPYAIGSVKDITAERRQNLNNLENQKIIEALGAQSILNWRVNLSQNGAIGLTAGEDWLKYAGLTSKARFVEAVLHVSDTVVEPSYRTQFLEFLNRDRMLTGYQNGIKTDSFIYRRKAPGEWRWAKVVYYLVLLDDSGDVYAYLYVIDINDEKQREQALLRRAERDSLTGLYNRQAAFKQIKKEIEKLCESGHTAALMMLDLDNFKQINDTYGHIYGDAVLSENAAKLREFFRDQDIVCRLGGDEFMIFCCNMPREYAWKKAEALCHKMERTYTSGGRRINLTASIGIAMLPDDGQNLTMLYDRADIALYRAKKEGKNTFRCFEEEMRQVHFTTTVVQDETTMQKEFSDYMAEYIFKMLYETPDEKRAVCSVLELISTHFKTQYAAFGVWKQGRTNFEISYCWHEEGYLDFEEELLVLFAEQGELLVSLFEGDDFILIENLASFSPELVCLSKKTKLSAITSVHISMGELGEGYLIFANCVGHEPSGFDPRDREQIRLAGEILAVFIGRLLNEQRYRKYANAMEAILERQNAAVYVVNQDRKLIYYNQCTHNIYPNASVGQSCFESLLGLDTPCPDCFLDQLENQGGPISIIKPLLMNNSYQRAHISVDRIEWPGEGLCAILTSVPMDEDCSEV